MSFIIKPEISIKAVSNVFHRLSRIFQPITAIPKESKDSEVSKQKSTSKSQRLMLELGIIKQGSPGSFHLLPLGMRALEKLTRLVDEEMSIIGAQKVMLPTLTNVKLWNSTGRLDEYGAELFTLQDRHNAKYILSPTHEESVSDLVASVFPISYKQFPLKLYQITSKYRDEIKPRFGLMRGRQFLMKDLYTFDTNIENARLTYEEVCDSYNSIFNKIGIDFVKVLGSSGAMGGSTSHEYHYKTDIGEDTLLFCLNCEHSSNVELSGDTCCPKCNSTNIKLTPGIEVGHTFMLGEKYSKPLKAKFLNENQKSVSLQMGSYGLGLSRILAASIEVLSSEYEIRWPRMLAPYTVIIISPKAGSKEEKSAWSSSEDVYRLVETVPGLAGNVLLDDRNQLTIGRRLIDARRVGYPYVIVLGGKTTPPEFELHDLNTDDKLFLNEKELLGYLNKVIAE